MNNIELNHKKHMPTISNKHYLLPRLSLNNQSTHNHNHFLESDKFIWRRSFFFSSKRFPEPQRFHRIENAKAQRCLVHRTVF